MYALNDPPNYAPSPDESFEAIAAARGVTPEEVVYDRFLETEGKGLFLAALGNYENGRLDAAHDMLMHPDCVPALGDGGAHYGALCDASYSTFLLSHFVRDGRSGGFDLVQAVHMLSQKAASAVGFTDRGVLKPGMKADINVIDMERLKLHLPSIVHDLPAGGRRLDQHDDERSGAVGDPGDAVARMVLAPVHHLHAGEPLEERDAGLEVADGQGDVAEPDVDMALGAGGLHGSTPPGPMRPPRRQL